MRWRRLIAGVAAAALLGAAGLASLDRYRVAALNTEGRRAAARLFPGGATQISAQLIAIAPRGASTRTGAVILVHAWGVPSPAAYRGLIAHLLDDGRIVLFPLYQKSFFPHEIAGRVVDILDRDRPAWRREARWIVGHSAGGTAAMDLSLREAGRTRLQGAVSLSPGDGTGPDGRRAATSVAMLPWGQTRPSAAAAARTPRFAILVSDADTLVGDHTARRQAAFLRRSVPAGRVRLMRLPPAERGCATHFWPLGGDDGYRLPAGTRFFAHTDAYGGCGGWRTDAVDRRLWRFLDEVLAPAPQVQS
jgi:hypothetical protein